MIINHEFVLYLLFSDEATQGKLEAISKKTLNIYTDIVCPLALSTIYIFAMPLLNCLYLWLKSIITDPAIAHLKKKELIFYYSNKLEVEDKRIDVVLRERERENRLEEERVRLLKEKTSEIDKAYIAAQKKTESEKLETEALEKKRVELERIKELESNTDNQELSTRLKNIEEREKKLLKNEREILSFYKERKIISDDINKITNSIKSVGSSQRWSKKNSSATNGDRVTIDFLGKINGKSIEGGHARNHQLILGNGKMIPGIEDNIIGHSAGDHFSVQVVYPDDYHAENLRDKKAEFDISLISVEEKLIQYSSLQSIIIELDIIAEKIQH